MKSSHAIAGILWGGLVAGALYFSESGAQKESVQITQEVKQRVTAITPFSPSETQPEDQDSLLSWLDRNPVLKRRIQATSWYRDFLAWKLGKKEFEKNLMSASSIEQVLEKNKWMLEKIQYQGWWQSYLRWDIDPTYMLLGNIWSFVRIEQFKEKNPEIYEKIIKNPGWNKPWYQGENHLLMSQDEIMDVFTRQMNALNNNKDLEERLSRFGFSRDDFYRADLSKQEWILAVFDTINHIEDKSDWSQKEREAFLATDTGRAYHEGKVSPDIALESLKKVRNPNGVNQ